MVRDEVMQQVAATLRAHCVYKGWSWDEMPRMTGVPHPTVQNAMQGDTTVSLETVEALCHGLRFNATELIARSEQAIAASAEAEAEARTVIEDTEARVAQLTDRGEDSEAFDVLLALCAATPHAEAREYARARLVELFSTARDQQAVRRARSRLTSLLY